MAKRRPSKNQPSSETKSQSAKLAGQSHAQQNGAAKQKGKVQQRANFNQRANGSPQGISLRSKAIFVIAGVSLFAGIVLWLALQNGYLSSNETADADRSSEDARSNRQSLQNLSIAELEEKLGVPSLSDIPESATSLDLEAWTAQLDDACHSLRSSFPNDAQAEHLYGLIQLRLKRTKLAEPSLRRAVELAPKNLQMRYDLADLLMQLGNDQEAQHLLSDVDAKAPVSVEYLILLADCQNRNGDLDNAERTLLKASQLAPNDFSAWLKLAKVQLQQQQLTDAEQSVRRSIQQNEKDAESWQVLQQTLRLQGRHEQAKQAFQQWEKLRVPSRIREAEAFNSELASSMIRVSSNCYRSLAVLYQANGNTELAQAMYQRALAANPRDASTLAGWATLQRNSGDFRSAAETTKKVIRIQPDNLASYQNLANLAMELNRPKDAEASLRLATLRLPDNGATHLVLANFLLFLNKPAEAREPAARAVQILRTSEAESLLRRIESSLSTK